jgi:hypothetical protein
MGSLLLDSLLYKELVISYKNVIYNARCTSIRNSLYYKELRIMLCGSPPKRLTKKATKSKNPVISVNTKKKEVLGDYKNGGKEWYKKRESPAVADHDFISPDAPRAYPYVRRHWV